MCREHKINIRLEIPLTGTVLAEEPLSGDPNDPVRPVNIDLGNVSWTKIGIDLKKEIMIIEVKPGEIISFPTGELNDEGDPKCISRLATEAEKSGFLQHAKELIEGYSKDELYQISGCPKLKRPFKEK